MKRYAITLSALCLTLASTFHTDAATPAFLSKADNAKMNHWVDSVYNSMSVDQRIGQLIAQVVDPRNLNAARQEIKRLADNYNVGAFYFSKGPAFNHATLANYAVSVSDVTPMICLDGEWGLSMRMPETPRFPKNMMLGAIQNDSLLYEYGREVARECHLIGVNVNFAPSVDVNSNPKNPVIGTRSFGENPDNVARKAAAYAHGLEDGGVLSVAKHFPGHGNTSEDSHKTLPAVNRSVEEIEATELVPFRAYCNEGLSGVMVAHLNIPSLDTGNLPTSLSPKVIDGMLRTDLGFEGLVFTDALAMKGARIKGRANGLLALEAGADVLLEPYNLSLNFKALKEYYAANAENAARIEKSCKKILAYKYAMGLNNRKDVKTDGLLVDINARQAELTLRKLYAAAITALKNDGNALPVRNLDRGVSVVSLGEASENVFSQTCRRYTEIDEYALTTANATPTFNALKKSGCVVVGIFDKKSSTADLLNRMVVEVGADKIVPVFFITPYDMADFSGAISLCPTAIVAYESQELAQEYAAQAVFGGIDITGRMPVTVEGVAYCGDGVDISASRLGYGMPEEAGLDAQLLHDIDSLANEGVRQGAFPGCEVLVVRNNKVVVNKAYGYTDASRTIPISTNTLYDLASVSKATGTIAGIMKAIDDGKMNLDDTLGLYTPQLAGTDKGRFTIRNLLYHETGMPAALNIYTQMTDSTSYTGPLVAGKKSAKFSRYAGGGYINNNARVRRDITSATKTGVFNYRIGHNLYVGQPTLDTIMSTIHNIPLRNNRNYLYSCLNFCLLMEAEQNVTGIRHDRFVADSIFHPIGAYRTVYRPLDYFKKSEIAPTENDEYLRGEVVLGSVHDETAAFSGGIQGNAGLFSNANDLAKLFQMWLNGGTYGGRRILSEETVDLFITEKSPNSHRGLGFDKPNIEHPEWSSTCEEAGPEVFGHTGFTGTCYWVDPKYDMIYIFLCNRVYPTRNNKAFTRVAARSGIMSAIYRSIERCQNEVTSGK